MAGAVGNEEDVWGKAIKAADDLYELRDTFFPQNPDDKISKLQQESDLALKPLDSIPAEQRKLPLQRATYEYLRGKILDVVPDYRKEAEDHLSKAVKLNPSLADAWLCLGNCIWKKGDLTSAKNCFNLALSKGSNKKILCQLSMLERRMVQDNLGNACLTSFFVTGAWDHSKLLQSLKAYQNAEKDERMKLNPDLYFNGATVNKYLENYDRALSGFEAAALKDPSLNAFEEVEKMVNLLKKLENLLKGHSREKILASLASTIGAVNLNSSYKRATLDVLSEGLNKGVAVVGKVLLFVKHESITPLRYYLVCDSNQSCFVLSVYGIRNDAIKEGDVLILLEPYFHNVEFSWKGKCYKFKSIRVDFLEQVLVNGKALPPHQAIRTSIFAQHKP
ncbi:tetratricopeptide repeat protein 5-like isoform X4 [Durio zibethinus]|uniref:Tetratricopeptide repeat protein 5-like isoform X4 n=1 Tax=Durio zibethinus TaxID=66656 RepID=A0A6P5XGI4_DURZI|nr:tetratricopeptide repeat protein 5-like isoform X4 [Durio zibethinus]